MPINNTAAGIVISANGLVLLLQRLDGTWGVPGGKAEPGEDPRYTAVRETYEETGINITGALTPLATVSNPDGFTFIAYSVDIGRAIEPVLSDEHKASMWADPKALPKPLFMATGDLIAELAPVAAMDLDDTMSARRIDANGWYEIKGNPISKVGVFQFIGDKIPGAEPGRIYNVYRPAEELSSPETIESIKLVPWIDDHVMLGPNGVPNTVPAEQKGIGGVVGQDVYFKGDTLYANVKLFSTKQGAVIDSGKTELSLGYRCKYEKSPGVFDGQQYDYIQRQIRGNHLASVDDGRMGPEVAVLDHFSFSFDSKDIQMADENKDDAGSGGGASPSIDDVVKAFTPLLPFMEKLLAMVNPAAAAAADPVDTSATVAPAVATGDADPTDDKDKKAAAAGATAAAADEDEKDKKVDAMDAAIKSMPGQVMKAIAHRDGLAKRLSAFVGAFDHADMTPGEVVTYGLEKLGLKSKAPKGAESAFLEGYLSNRKSPAEGKTAIADGMDAVDGGKKDPEFLANYLSPKE